MAGTTADEVALYQGRTESGREVLAIRFQRDGHKRAHSIALPHGMTLEQGRRRLSELSGVTIPLDMEPVRV